MSNGKVIQIRRARPDAEEMKYFWKLYSAAQRVEDRWCTNTVPCIADALADTELSREEKLFLLRARQVLVDDRGGFGRHLGALDTYIHNIQDPNDGCVGYKPELKACLEDGLLFDVMCEAYAEAKTRIAELEARTVTLPPTFWYEHDDLPREIPVLSRRLVINALREAGVKSPLALA